MQYPFTYNYRITEVLREHLKWMNEYTQEMKFFLGYPPYFSSMHASVKWHFSGMFKCSYCKNGWLPVALLSKWLYSAVRKGNSLNADVFNLNTPMRHKVCAQQTEKHENYLSTNT